MTFKPGQSGNPRGRPRGIPDRRTLLTKALADAAPGVSAKVVAMALEGDMQAASLVLSRVHPPLRPRSETVTFDLNPDAPVAEQAKQIIMATACGQIDPDTCKMLMDCLSAFVGLKDVETLLSHMRQLKNNSPAIPGGVVTYGDNSPHQN